MADAKEKLAGINARAMALYKADGKTMGAFRELMASATREGRLSPAMKEMVAIAVAVARGCEDCIVFHAHEAKGRGASREELVEILAVAIEMSGGPGTVYAGKALAAFDEL
ncbi:carboxymuconolactone decarboxylase family protein [Stappia sp.]|jgi:AhpD family alkylhydroperoxidase|uniref:carboxymuconolactone decarboxylase family protein n=1 Tax=Stappia sp. TaxID=1870903 RepID=UPI003A995F3C